MEPRNIIIRIFRPGIILSFFILLVAINYANCNSPGDPAAKVSPLVSSAWLKENISDPRLVILHVSAVKLDYDNGHIPGAQFLWPGYVVISTEAQSIVPASVKDVTRVLRSLGVNNDSHIILCGIYGNLIPVCRVFVNLEHFGLRGRVSIVNGGFDEWKAAGYEVSKEIPSAKKGNFTASLYNNLVDINFMTANLTNKSYTIIDARPKSQYDGTLGLQRAGHIPGAKNLPQPEMYDPKTFIFADAGKIIQAFTKLEISEGSRPLFYCHTGNQASIDYVAAIIAGFDPIMYDGSMEEWASRFDLPMESLLHKSLSDKYDQQLKDGWSVESSVKVNASGDIISKQGFDASKWYKTTVPATVMAALIANNEYPDIFMGDNINRVDTARFRSPWWYRNEFDIDDAEKNTELIFEGINYRANVWLNGTKVASADTLFGGFRIFKLDVSKFIVDGNNILALEVIHPRPDEPSVGFVDWAPMPPDRLMGLWRPVKIRRSGTASLDNIFVVSEIDKKNYKEADLQISAEAINNTSETVEAIVKGTIENISIVKKITLKPNEKQQVVFSSSEYPQLKIKNPRLWWTYDMGKPELYALNLEIEVSSKVSYMKTTRFGIRDVEDYFNAGGHRGYKLNGVEVLIKGGGWVDGMFLNDTEEKVKAQFEYVRHANMNTIRLEGFWGNSERFYELADELGLLIMTGWSCQWEWGGYLDKPEDDFMSIRTPEDIELIINYTRDHVNWLRNHPSIFVWVMGSDKLPRPELEEKYYPLFKELDPSRPLLMSCKGQTSIISGRSAVKMNGPYDYTSPNYWYIDTINGGAFGFNTETGPGPQVPSLEVLKTMIPEDKLWPVNDMWNFHCGRGAFKTLNHYLVAFNKRYGEQNNVEDFTFKSQASNLEAMRAMYEAFAVSRSNTTGIIQWMYNSAWPKLIWQFWDYNLLPNASFYGARLGARQVNIAYNYGDNSVYVTNLTPGDINNYKASIKIYSFDGKIIKEKQETASLKANSSLKLYKLPSDEKNSKVYFLKLELAGEHGNAVADNFYWLSTKKDVPDFKNTTWFYTPLSEYADFTDLDKLPKVKVAIESTTRNVDDNYEITVTLINPGDNIAFLIELSVVGDKSGKSIVPILWDDNYISLLPKEKRVVKAKFSVASLNGEKPVFRSKGWNLE